MKGLTASMLQLDRAAVKALRITDAYSLHRVVYSLFEDVRSDAQKKGSEASGILYAEQGGNFYQRTILLLSDRPPASSINGQYGIVRSRPVPEDFLSHGHYRFKVIINPTRRDSASGKLKPVKGREAVAQWFMERATHNWGFEASRQHLQIDRIQVLQFKDKVQRPVTLAQAHVQGLLTVANREQFQHSFRSGVGRGRAFGCGLLQLVPLIDRSFA